MSDSDGRLCLCGCAKRIKAKRRDAKFVSENCRSRYHTRNRRGNSLDLSKVVTVAQYAAMTNTPEWKVRYEIQRGRIQPVRVPAKIMIRMPK